MKLDNLHPIFDLQGSYLENENNNRIIVRLRKIPIMAVIYMRTNTNVTDSGKKEKKNMYWVKIYYAIKSMSLISIKYKLMAKEN